MSKVKRKSLVSKMDTEAEALLASNDKASLETRIAIFAQVARWVQVRHRLTDADETSGLLDEYRRTINQAQSEVAQRESDRLRRLNWERGPGHDGSKPYDRMGRKQRVARAGSGHNGGAELDALKARLPEPGLPAADVGDVDGDRGGAGGTISIAVGNRRIVRPELSGDTDTELDEPRSDSEF